MKRLPLAVLVALVVACGGPAPTPVAPSPTPSPSRITCAAFLPPGPTPLPGGCPAEERAVQAAVASLGYPVREMEIHAEGFPCGVPFPADLLHSAAPGCPASATGPTAYVSFFGTAEVAALTFTEKADGSVRAIVVAFEVPPMGAAPA